LKSKQPYYFLVNNFLFLSFNGLSVAEFFYNGIDFANALAVQQDHALQH